LGVYLINSYGNFNHMALVSVIIPYNEDRGFLREAINSVKNQTYPCELILSNSPATGGKNINNALKTITSDFWCFLSEDDKLTPNSIKDRLEAMQEFDFIHARAEYFGLENKPYSLTNPNITFESCLKNNGIMGGSVMYRTESTKGIYFDEELWTGGEWYYNLLLLSKGKSLGFLDKSVYLYRRHSKQKSIGNISTEYQAKRNKVKEEIRCRFTKPL